MMISQFWWFHAHRKLFGTTKAATTGIILYCSMVLLLVALVHHLTDEEVEEGILLSTGLILWCILQSVAVVLPFLLILFVVCSIPRHYDNFGISREVSWTAVCYAVVLVTATLLNVWILRYHSTITKELFSAVELVMLMMWRIAFFGIAMLQVRPLNPFKISIEISIEMSIEISIGKRLEIQFILFSNLNSDSVSSPLFPLYVLVEIQTKYPIDKFGHILKRYSASSAMRLAHEETLMALRGDEEDSISALDNVDLGGHTPFDGLVRPTTLGMKQVLADDQSFDLFVKHCSNGISECI